MNPIEITENDINFNSLYVSLPYTKVVCNEDCMVYFNIPFGYVEKTTEEINNKIKELNLPLIAKANARNSLFQDSILIEPINK